jgi:hypothetical protein
MDVVLNDLTCPVATAVPNGLPVPPALLAPPEQVATVRLKVTVMHTGRPVLIEPLIDVAEMLPRESTVGSLTIRVSGRRDGSDRRIGLEARVSVIGDANAVLEADRLGSYLQAAYATNLSVFDLAADVPDDGWPDTGTVTLVRQQVVQTRAGEVPIRFAPGPRLGRDRLLRAVLAANSDIDVIITVQPTHLSDSERSRLLDVQAGLLALRDRTDQPAPTRIVDGYPLERLIATVTDAAASYATSSWIAQTVIVENGASSEVTRRVIGQAIAGSYDTADGPGQRTVANPSSFISGGFELIPVRNPASMLDAARLGQLVQHDHRSISDLVTAGEIPNLMCWPTGNDGPIPGIAQNMPGLDQIRSVREGDLIIGHVADDGRPVPLSRPEATQHALYVGATGAGKSAALHSSVSQAIAAGRGVVVFDANDDLARLAAHAAVAAGRETVLVDLASGSGDRVCLWAGATDEEIDDLAYAVIEGAVADIPTEFYGPMGRKFLEPAARVCARLGLPLSTISEYGTNTKLAREHAARVGEKWAIQWAAELSGRSPHEQVELGSFISSKLSGLCREVVSDTLLSPRPTTSLRSVLERGGVVIINPGPDPSTARIVTGVLLAYLDRWARTRTATSSPVDVIVDEGQNAAGAMLTRCLTEWRKRNLSLHIAATTLGMFARSADAAIANTSTTLLFRNRGATANALGALFDLDPADISKLPNLACFAVTPTVIEPVLLDIAPRPATPDRYPDLLTEEMAVRSRVADEGPPAIAGDDLGDWEGADKPDPTDDFDDAGGTHDATAISGSTFIDSWLARRNARPTSTNDNLGDDL